MRSRLTSRLSRSATASTALTHISAIARLQRLTLWQEDAGREYERISKGGRTYQEGEISSGVPRLREAAHILELRVVEHV